jgi:hypothetical protein
VVAVRTPDEYEPAESRARREKRKAAEEEAERLERKLLWGTEPTATVQRGPLLILIGLAMAGGGSKDELVSALFMTEEVL